MQLVIASKRYSSWSLRAWLGLKMAGIAFEEILIPLYRDDTRARLLAYSPAGKAPLLIDGDIKVWDSLAIAEYLAEKFPGKQLWPAKVADRALARSLCAEMHAGFQALRGLCPMDIPARERVTMTPALQADIDRIIAIWCECRTQHAGQDPYLFGRFSWADAFFAPVVSRFISYGIELPEPARAYAQTMMHLPAMQQWIAAAEQEAPKPA